jgi:hypothetical protein
LWFSSAKNKKTLKDRKKILDTCIIHREAFLAKENPRSYVKSTGYFFWMVIIDFSGK